MASGLNEEHVEKKLMTVNNTQDSIQGLSLWIIHHKSHHARIVELWAKVMKKTPKPSHRLTLYYLCNDVVQNCKRKKAVVYVDTFKQHLKQLTPLVRDVSIKLKIERIFNIWEERQVYDKDFVEDLRAILDGKRADGVPVKKSPKKPKEVSATPPVTHAADVFEEIQPPDATLDLTKDDEKEKEKPKEADIPTPEVLAEFKPQEMVDKIRSYKRQEGEVEVKVRQLAHLKLDASSIEAVKQLKDRAHGNEFSTHFEESCQRLEEAAKGLEKKHQEQADLLALLRISEYFYDEQNREAKIVANAYKNFGSRINSMKRRLDELKRSLPSPIPSPSVDAPSPGNTPPHLESNTVPVDMDIDNGDDGALPPEAFTQPRVALTNTTSSIIKPISSIKEITFADDEIPSPPDEAPSPVSSPEDMGLDSKGGSSLENRLASFIPSLQGAKKDQPIPVYVPQPLNSSSGDSGRRPSANRTLTELVIPFPEEEGGSTPLTDERPSTPVLDEGPSETAPPPPPPPLPASEKKKKKENPMDFLSRLILSQTQSKPTTPSSTFLEGFSQLTTKVKEHMEASKSNGNAGNISPVGMQGPKSWADWKAQTAEKSDDIGMVPTSMPPPPIPTFAMPPPPPPVPPPVMPTVLGMPPPRMPPPLNSPPHSFYQQTSPGQKENWPEVQGGVGDGGEAGPSPTMMYPSVPGDVPPPPFPPPISKPQSAPAKGILRKSSHSVLKELTRSDDAAASGMQLPPPPPPPPPPFQSPVSSAPPVSVSQPKTVDQPPSPLLGPPGGPGPHDEAQEFMEKLKRKTMMGSGPSSYTPNPVRPNLMTLTPGSDGDEGMGEMDMDLDEEEGGVEEEEASEGLPGRPKGIPVLSSVVRRVDPAEKQLRDKERLKDRDMGNHDHMRDTFHKDRHYGRRASDEYYPPPSSDPSSSNYDYRDDHMYGYGPEEPAYFDQYPPNPGPFYGRNPQQGFSYRPMPPKRPFGKRGGFSRRPNYY